MKPAYRQKEYFSSRQEAEDFAMRNFHLVEDALKSEFIEMNIQTVEDGMGELTLNVYHGSPVMATMMEIDGELQLAVFEMDWTKGRR